MSEAQTLKTLFPVPLELPLGGKLVRVGKLKLRQKAELQAWLDELPAPSPRVKDVLDQYERTQKWPLTLDGLPILVEADYVARIHFLRVALAPFNPEFTSDELDSIVSNCDDDDEYMAVMYAAYGQSMKEQDPAAQNPKAEAEPPHVST